MTEKYERLKALIETMTKGTNMDDDGTFYTSFSKADCGMIAMALRSLKAVADEHHNSGPFICGTIGEKDASGLYDKFMVCPQYGLSGFAVYKKDSEYSEPGY